MKTCIKKLHRQGPASTQRQSLSKVGGFTLIEIMVSVAIFAIIITSGIGALVTMTQSYSKAQKNKQVHQGLNYALETMTREIRLGKNFQANPTGILGGIGGVDGIGSSLRVTTSDRRGTVRYYLNNGVLFLERTNALNAQNGTFALTNANQIIIDNVRFTVTGTAEWATPDYHQPLVWIQIQAHATGEPDKTSVQTLVSQRTLDF